MGKYTNLDGKSSLEENIKSIISIDHKKIENELDEKGILKKTSEINQYFNGEGKNISLGTKEIICVNTIKYCCGAYILKGQTDYHRDGFLENLDRLNYLIKYSSIKNKIESYIDIEYDLYNDVLPLIIKEIIKYLAHTEDKLYVIANDLYEQEDYLNKIGLEITKTFDAENIDRNPISIYSANLDYFRKMDKYMDTNEYKKRVEKTKVAT